MAPPLTIPAGSPRSWNPNAIKDFGPHSLDERTRNALEAFENAVRPAGLAAGGSDGEKVRARSTKLLDKECRGLVNAGEQLVAAVAKLGECPMLVMLLQKLPRLLARQAVMIALSDVMPELLDRECLKTQVDEMQKKQLSSTTQYLKELGAVRSRLRHVSAAPGAAPTAPGTIARPATVDEPDVEPGGGDTPQQSPSMASVTSVSSRRGSANGGLERSETRRMSSSLRPAKQGGPQPSLSRRTSFADGAEQVNIEVTGPDDVVGSNETLEPKSSPSLQSMTSRKARRSISVTAAANAAMAFKRSQVMAATTNDLEVGPEFGDVHHYMWDAVEHLDKGLQVIVCKVIAEKLQCFKTQKEQTSVAELRALCKRLESYLKGTAAEEHERQLQEVLAEMEEKHGEIRRLTETIQVNAETAEEAKKKLLKTMDEKDKLRDTIQRELVETQAKLESSQLKLQELTQQVSKLKEAEALRQKERAALQKERKKVVHFSHKAEGGTANIKDFFQHFLPKMVLHLSKELRDPAMQEHLLQTLDLLQRDYAEAEKKHQSVISRAKSAEQEVADLSAKARKLEQWKVTLEEQNAVLQERIAEVENNMVQLQSGFLDAIHKAPAYMSLREEYEILKCECEGIAVRTQMLQAEIYRRDEDKAQLQGQIEERDARIARLEDEVRDVAASQLHPTQVAQLRADLKRTKHECEALSNANEVLRNTLATISEKLEKPEGEDPMRDVSLIKDMCSRSVHNRLYEDAVRRQDRNSDSPERPLEHAESWAAGHTDKRPHSASAVPRKPSPGSSPTNLAIGRSRSEPSSRILQQMLQTNAQSLRGMLDEPLFHHNLRLPVSPGRPPELANLPGMQVSPSTTLHSPSVTPRCHDFAQLSEIVSEIVPRSHLAGKSSPRPPSSRSAACSSRSPSRPRCVSRFGAESPGFSPRTQREGTPTESARPSRQPSDATPRDTKRGNFAEAVAELRAETGWRSRPQSAEDSKPGERPATHTGVLRDIFDPKEKEEEPHVHRRAMPVAVKPRSCTNSPQQLPERATPRITYPRPHPRVAASLLPTVRPKSARPPPLVPFMSTSPMRPQSCDP